ncbi:hypothetical protein [Actinoplanes sp. NPDC023714]|uniref:hypothetical protein n=1 Tax=Actinoplanes sp. NPDC023714 TaxID=3154322 RepID=UPI0033FEDAA5
MTAGAPVAVGSGRPASAWPLVATGGDGGQPNLWSANAAAGTLYYNPSAGPDKLSGQVLVGNGGWQSVTSLS